MNLDCLTYAGNAANLASLRGNPRYEFVHGDINDRTLVRRIFHDHQPAAIVHFAAESHVDRSILGPDEFIRTNINGTFSLLTEAKSVLGEPGLPATSSDSAFCTCPPTKCTDRWGKTTRHFAKPRLTRRTVPTRRRRRLPITWCAPTFTPTACPTLTTNCSNNYGPFQFPEKLIPLVILNALKGKPLPVYGDGKNVRDWLYVGDHCAAIRRVLHDGRPGETYNIGGRSEQRNIEVVRTICAVLDELRPELARQAARGPHPLRDRPSRP